jgi:hypothetical protein
MSPVPPILHILALAAGLWLGWTAMSAISPDLEPNAPAGVEAAAAQVTGPGDPQSLFQPSALSTALTQLQDQLGDDEEITSMTIHPGRLESSSSSSGDGFPVAGISSAGPYLLAYSIDQRRREPIGVDDLVAVSVAPTAAGPLWTARLDRRLPGPHTWRAVIRPGDVAFEVKARPVPGK